MTDQKLSEHFWLHEFVRAGDKVTPQIILNLTHLAQKLERVRSFFGDKPITITCGYRTWAHHLEIYHNQLGITDPKKIPTHSFHLTGEAADFVVAGVPVTEAIRRLDPWWEGGLEKGVTSHVHADIGSKRRFYGTG